jgi:hypothetical protein
MKKVGGECNSEPALRTFFSATQWAALVLRVLFVGRVLRGSMHRRRSRSTIENARLGWSAKVIFPSPPRWQEAPWRCTW